MSTTAARRVMCRCDLEEAHQHLGIVEVSREFMANLFYPSPPHHWFRIKEGLPLDAQFLVAEFVIDTLVYRFLFESPEFPAVRDGAPVTYVVRVTTQLFINERAEERPWG